MSSENFGPWWQIAVQKMSRFQNNSCFQFEYAAAPSSPYSGEAFEKIGFFFEILNVNCQLCIALLCKRKDHSPATPQKLDENLIKTSENKVKYFWKICEKIYKVNCQRCIHQIALTKWTLNMTGGTLEIRSDKSLTLLTFDIQPMDQWTNGPMEQWNTQHSISILWQDSPKIVPI